MLFDYGMSVTVTRAVTIIVNCDRNPVHDSNRDKGRDFNRDHEHDCGRENDHCRFMLRERS